jgi:hypothetical protein
MALMTNSQVDYVLALQNINAELLTALREMVAEKTSSMCKSDWEKLEPNSPLEIALLALANAEKVAS